MKPNQGTSIIGVNTMEDERNEVPREPTFDTSGIIYDENSESVIDALLRIFDTGNNVSVETNFTSVGNMSIDEHQQRKVTVGRVRGTKRKRSDVSKTKDGKYQCQQCDYEATQSIHLSTHIKYKHEGIRYPCDQCDYKATQEGHLRRHKEIKHEGVRFPCDKCDYKGVTRDALKVHKESKHQGVCYSCDDCNYKATTPASLKIHVESIHEGVRYPCDQCDYKATQQGSLRKHKEINHKY